MHLRIKEGHQIDLIIYRGKVKRFPKVTMIRIIEKSKIAYDFVCQHNYQSNHNDDLSIFSILIK